MPKNLLTSSSPHIRGNYRTQRMMLDVIIALIPAMIAGVVFFGTRVIWVILVTVISAVASEYVSRKIMKRDNTIWDLSAVVTGVLLALNFTPTIPLWICAVGGAIAIIIVKQMFGGIGQNFMNPALGARVILVVSWPAQMTNWMQPKTIDAVSSATPLAIVKQGGGELPEYIDMFIGQIGGCIGETSALALLIGGAYLLMRRVISYEIPLFYVGTFSLFTWIFGGESFFSADVLFHVLAGGLLIGAIFMATDYSSSPMTKKGKIIFGIGCGLLTFVIRFFTGYNEGVSFAIILMNLFVPLIDRYVRPVTFGGAKKNEKSN